MGRIKPSLAEGVMTKRYYCPISFNTQILNITKLRYGGILPEIGKPPYEFGWGGYGTTDDDKDGMHELDCSHMVNSASNAALARTCTHVPACPGSQSGHHYRESVSMNRRSPMKDERIPKMRKLWLGLILVLALLACFACSKDEGLIRAAACGNLQEAKEYLDKGADINAKDRMMGATPLMGAALGGHSEIAEFLLKRGADVNARAEDGSTALILATSRDKLDLVRLLLNAGGT